MSYTYLTRNARIHVRYNFPCLVFLFNIIIRHQRTRQRQPPYSIPFPFDSLFNRCCIIGRWRAPACWRTIVRTMVTCSGGSVVKGGRPKLGREGRTKLGEGEKNWRENELLGFYFLFFYVYNIWLGLLMWVVMACWAFVFI